MAGSRRWRCWTGALIGLLLALPATAAAQAGSRDFEVDARPDGSGLPGFSEAGDLVNGVLAFAALATLAAFIVGAALMAFGGLTSNYRASGHARRLCWRQWSARSSWAAPCPSSTSSSTPGRADASQRPDRL